MLWKIVGVFLFCLLSSRCAFKGGCVSKASGEKSDAGIVDGGADQDGGSQYPRGGGDN